MKLLHHYHLWVGGSWRHILDEHLDTLARAGFDGEFTINLRGPEEAVGEAREIVAQSTFSPTIFDLGHDFENDSINYVRDRARIAGRAGENLAIMYAHSKGAWHVAEINEIWRHRMEQSLVKEWRYCLGLLGEVDVVGCHWLTAGEFPGLVGEETPFFGGNYWMATAAYLESLPPCGTEDRFDAEGWIGLGKPSVADLTPGWPP